MYYLGAVSCIAPTQTNNVSFCIAQGTVTQAFARNKPMILAPHLTETSMQSLGSLSWPNVQKHAGIEGGLDKIVVVTKSAPKLFSYADIVFSFNSSSYIRNTKSYEFNRKFFGFESLFLDIFRS